MLLSISQVHGMNKIFFKNKFYFVKIKICFSFITGSYDRTCKVWDTASGEELHTLDGHRNVVYAISFNNPYGYFDK